MIPAGKPQILPSGCVAIFSPAQTPLHYMHYRSLPSLASLAHHHCGVACETMVCSLAQTSLPWSAPLPLGLQKPNSRLTGATQAHVAGGGETNFISSEIYTCTYRRRTPELKINKYKTWAWQGQKLHNMN